MSVRHHPSRWASVRLEDRNRLPQTSGVYAIAKQKKIYYIGFSTNLNRRWRGKGHHRFLQADRLGRCNLHYLPLPKQRAKEFEKLLIAEYGPPWNYSKVPVLRKVSWIRRIAAVAVCLLVLFIFSRSLVLGMMAAIIAAIMFY
ncbi:MAG: GIY-YIG nuclease family protein [Cyanobacteria bacterium P01_A01_bin.15]